MPLTGSLLRSNGLTTDGISLHKGTSILMRAFPSWLIFSLASILSVTAKVSAQVGTSNDIVSLYELIVAPEEYNDQTVFVSGYLLFEDRKLFLYPTRDDAIMGNYVASVAVEVSPDLLDKKCFNNFVLVSGIFQSTDRAKSITDIYAVSVIERSRRSRTRNVCYLNTSQ